MSRRLERLAAAGLLVALAGCAQRMDEQAKARPLRPSPLFSDGRSARPAVEGAVAVESSPRPSLDEGRDGKTFARRFPMTVDRALLARGRERYDVYCAVCHDRTGAGDGMIVRRGFPAPPSFHEPRLRAAPPGLFVATIAGGVGRMFPYADRVAPRDRWAIAAYIRALQLRERVPVARLTEKERRKLEAMR
jgi:mono/diheme cytochrome c family protein